MKATWFMLALLTIVTGLSITAAQADAVMLELSVASVTGDTDLSASLTDSQPVDPVEEDQDGDDAELQDPPAE